MSYNLFTCSNSSRPNRIHLIGIGGVGMSSIAQLLHFFGYNIQGSDVLMNENIDKLIKLGITVFFKHSCANIFDVDCIVYSSAIKSTNEELSFAIENKKIIFHRSEVIAQLSWLKRTIAISGSHGKTTTTAMISSIFDSARLEQTSIIGGIVNDYDNNIKIGTSDWLVVEADESDGSMLNIDPDVLVITNIDGEHLEYYKTPKLLEEYFCRFISKIPRDGCVICFTEIPSIILNELQCNKIVYGFESHADVVASNIRSCEYKTFFDLSVSCDIRFKESNSTLIKNVELSAIGEHNVANSLAAISVAIQLGIPLQIIRDGLANFSGVKRRFSLIERTKTVRFFDDYAHHPKEIESVLMSAKSISKGRIVCIIQPHRFTRVRDFFDQFVEILIKFDYVIIMNVYSAGEDEILGFTSRDLLNSVSLSGSVSCSMATNEQSITSLINDIIQEHDIFLFVGAGDITKITHNVAKNIKVLHYDL